MVARGRPDDPPQAGWVGSLRGAEPGRPVARWLEAPVLAGAGVVLRPWREDDRAALAGAAASDDMGPVLPATDAEGFAGWLLRQREQMASAAGVDWCLSDPRTDRALGWLGVSRLGMPLRHGSGTVGHWLLPYARGRGVLTEALRLAARHAFAPAPEDRERTARPGLGLHRLTADTDVGNAASQATLVRAGWRWVGTEQDSYVRAPGGRREDTVRFELLAVPEDRPWRAPALPDPPRLTAERVVLRPFAAGDLGAVAGMLRCPDIGPDHDADADGPPSAG